MLVKLQKNEQTERTQKARDKHVTSLEPLPILAV